LGRHDCIARRTEKVPAGEAFLTGTERTEARPVNDCQTIRALGTLDRPDAIPDEMAARERQPALPHAAERFLDGLCGLDIDEAASNLDASIRLSAGFQRLADAGVNRINVNP